MGGFNSRLLGAIFYFICFLYLVTYIEDDISAWAEVWGMAWLSILTITAPAGEYRENLEFSSRRWREIPLNGNTTGNIERVLRIVCYPHMVCWAWAMCSITTHRVRAPIMVR